MSALWHIELFGGLTVTSRDRTIRRFRTQATAALLAYLAYHRRRTHPRDELVELFWPEADLDGGRNNLRVALNSLRRQLEPPGIPSGAVLVADRSTVRLNAEAIATDVAAFEASLQAAARSSDPSERARHRTVAVDTYRGDLLPGFTVSWVLQERERLAEAFHQALASLIVDLRALGDLPLALQHARRAVAADPLREEAHQALIRLLSESGQPDAARRQYEELERLLRAELDATPSAATRTLIDQRPPTIDHRPSPAEHRAPSTEHQAPSRSDLPRGTVSFLLTDIEGSTAAWERSRTGFPAARATHDALLRELFQEHRGHEVKSLGDGFLAAFEAATDALAAAIAGQQELERAPWPDGVAPLRVRMALCTGDAELRDGDYHGLVLHAASRVLAAGHGGQILCSEATATLLRRDLPPGVRLVDLGVHRLRDLAAPERLFQVAYPEMATPAFPPLRTEAGYTSHLPPSFTRFFGREVECAGLEALLRAPGTQLLTLTGPGGTGKTRLVLEIGRRLVSEWQGAVWFVPLGEVTEARAIPIAIRDAMRLPPAANREPLEQVVEALAHQPTLLILDNFEQLVETGAEVVQTLRERVTGLTCLISSRLRLGLPGEREFPVAPLPTPSGSSAPEELMRSESVQLFVDRAQGVRPDFQVTPGNAEALASLCRGLEGIPLALELAAARAQVLSPAQMVAHLSRRFDFLVNRQRTAAARHRTLRAAIDWSYHLLTPELQRFFARLSVFRGGWTAEAAQSVCREPHTLDYLEELCAASMLLPADERDRFHILDTLRDYGQECLETAGDTDTTRREHARYYLELAETWPKHVVTESEHDNFRAALRWIAESGEAEWGLRLAHILWHYWIVRAHMTEGRAWIAQFLAMTDRETTAPSRARALLGAGCMALHQGDYTNAREVLTECVAIWRSEGEPGELASALTQLGHTAREQGDLATARAYYEECLSLSREIGSDAGIAWGLTHLGLAIHEQGDTATARGLLEEAVVRQRAVGNSHNLALALNNLGIVTHAGGDLATARALQEEALALQRAMSDMH
jgi:predicted ATPase/DNA-binding SARP family transcriptional activator